MRSVTGKGALLGLILGAGLVWLLMRAISSSVGDAVAVDPQLQDERRAVRQDPIVSLSFPIERAPADVSLQEPRVGDVVIRSACNAEALPFLALRVTPLGGQSFDLLTSSAGIAAIAEHLPCDLSLQEDPSTTYELPRDASDGSLSVPMWASYWIDFRTPDRPAYPGEALEARFALSPTGELGAPVRWADGRFLVRLTEAQLKCLPPRETVLWVLGTGAQVRGRFAVPTTCGDHELATDAMRIGEILGSLKNEVGSPVADVQVLLIRKEKDGDARISVASSDEAGRFQFAGVSEGEYELRAESQIHGSCVEFLRVRGDGVEQVVCRLLSPAGGTVSGHLVSSDGETTPFGCMVLRGRDNPKRNYIVELSSGPGHLPGSADFEFGHAERGSYALYAFLEKGGKQVELLLQDAIEPPDLGQTWTIDMDALGTLRRKLVVVDSDTRAPLERAFLAVERDGESSILNMPGDAVWVDEVRISLAGLRISAPGYRERRVELVELLDNEDLVVVLNKGWSVRVLVFDQDDKGVENCEVLLDGTVVATTDSDGSVVVSGDGIPGPLGVRWRGIEGTPSLLDVSDFDPIMLLAGAIFTIIR